MSDVDPGQPWLDCVRFDPQGLVTTVAQDYQTGRVLMVAWMNRETLLETATTRQAVYFSRSRQRRWRKGEESGHTQTVKWIRLDCDGDVVLLGVEQAGGVACHTGRPSCFFLDLADETPTPETRWQLADPVALSPSSTVISRLDELIRQRLSADPKQSYVAKLLHGPLEAALKKIGEEAVEFVLAAQALSVTDDQTHDVCTDDRLADLLGEAADLWFHALVVLVRQGASGEQVLDVLQRRFGVSGLVEKASRAG